MWELDHKESWALKNWCFRTMVLEKTLERSFDNRKIKQINLTGNRPWILIGRTDAEAKAPILWPPDANNHLIGKDPDAGKDWRQKEKRVTEDEMVQWHHECNGHELGQTPGDGEGQGSLACWSPWGRKELDTTWRVTNNKQNILSYPNKEYRLFLAYLFRKHCSVWKNSIQKMTAIQNTKLRN